ncbi:hypothetical protein OA90_26875 [Labrenzia sp. OB1]|nr:hypothetical protein OA90_26875 [Labrenzia sp. OB1]
MQSELALAYRPPFTMANLTGLSIPGNMGDAEVEAMRDQLEAKQLASDNTVMKSISNGSKVRNARGEFRQNIKSIEANKNEIEGLEKLILPLENQISQLQEAQETENGQEAQETENGQEAQETENGQEAQETENGQEAVNKQIEALSNQIKQINDDIKSKQNEINRAENYKSVLLFKISDSLLQKVGPENGSVLGDTDDDTEKSKELAVLFPNLEKLRYRILQDNNTTEFIMDNARERHLSIIDDKAFWLAARLALTNEGLNSFQDLLASELELSAQLPGNSSRYHLGI